MAIINPIMNQLNSSAKGMVDAIVKNSNTKRTFIKEFFATANVHDAQSQALIAFYTAKNNAFDTVRNDTVRLKNLGSILEKEILEVPELKLQANKFVKALNKKYNKTLENRISLAAQGAVIADKVQPKSRFKKFLVSFNKFLSVLSDTSE